MSSKKPVRAMKARRTSVLSCGHLVTVVTLIVKEAGGRWICADCALADVRDWDLCGCAR